MFARLFRRPYHHLNQIVVSPAALRHNYTALSRLHPTARIAPVLKSNAYGHGLRTVAPVFDQFNAPFLIVDSLFEAYELMKLHIRTPVLILGYTHPDNWRHKRLPFHVTVFDLKTAQALNDCQPGVAIHIFVDTGMGREGVPVADLPLFLRELKKLHRLRIVGLASHFADADNPRSLAATQVQLRQYHRAIAMMREAGIEPQWRHLAASAGTLRLQPNDLDCNLFRVGLASYGFSPLTRQLEKDQKVTLEPALRFLSTVAQLKTVVAGQAVGYNGTFVAKRSMKLALLPAGYYEGVDRRLSNVGVVKLRGKICPIVGRVSMNMTTIDVTRVPDVAVGDEVEIFGDDSSTPNSIPVAARTAHTIPYDLLVGFAESVHRRLETSRAERIENH